MRNLSLSFAGALVAHLFLLLSPLTGPLKPVVLETPRQGGGIAVHFVQDVLTRNDNKTTSPLPMESEARGRQAGSKPEKRLKVAKASSPKVRTALPLMKKVERSRAERWNEQPVLDGAVGAIHFETSALNEVPHPEFKIQENGGEGVVETVSKGEALPLLDKNLKPSYPPLARRRGWQGTVFLEVMVKEDGTVGSLFVHTSSGYRLLDKTALSAVRKWIFMAAQKKGLAVPSRVLVPIHFILDNATIRENT